ncbi:MAG: HNH endonuclease [Tolypothrix carrinoi HA7290-LM1]|nr:HNH endonuclease [Tolypothrix carrinoi HA7290-LM1]
MIPISRQGADSEFNLALACRSCNLRKGNRVSGIDPDSNIEVRFFHPRQDQWDNHFQVDTTSAMIVGTTEKGRITVDCLEMNSQPQMMARQLWIRLNLFP